MFHFLRFFFPPSEAQIFPKHALFHSSKLWQPEQLSLSHPGSTKAFTSQLLCTPPTHYRSCEFPSSMEFWKFPHKMLLIYPCRIGARAHSRDFLDFIATAAKTGILLLLLQSSCRSPWKAERRCSAGARMPQSCHRCLGVVLVSGTSANGTSAKREKECSLVPH